MMLGDEFNIDKPRIAKPSRLRKRAQKEHMQFIFKISASRVILVNVLRVLTCSLEALFKVIFMQKFELLVPSVCHSIRA